MIDYRAVPVEELLPHSPPMVLIDRIIDYSSNSLLSEVVISKKSMFFDERVSGVPSWVGIEYMAQSIAALAGIAAKLNDRPVNIGFLLGTRKYLMPYKVFVEHEKYQINVSELFKDDSGLASFECQVYCNEELWAESKVNVFETNNMS